MISPNRQNRPNSKPINQPIGNRGNHLADRPADEPDSTATAAKGLSQASDDAKQFQRLTKQLQQVPPHRVLFVDDVQAMTRFYKTLLTTFGQEVRTAGSGEEALECAIDFHPHIVICDLLLPGIDGLEVARQIRANPELHGVFLIAFISDRTIAMNLDWKAAGFDAELHKHNHQFVKLANFLLSPLRFP